VPHVSSLGYVKQAALALPTRVIRGKNRDGNMINILKAHLRDAGIDVDATVPVTRFDLACCRFG